MAEIATQNDTGTDKSKKVYATDEAGMMADAKSYAKRDATSLIALFKKLGYNVVNANNETIEGSKNISEELICKMLIAVKYEQIEKARTERPTHEQYFD